MSGSVDEILVGANGDVFVANPGSTVPTDPTTAYSSAWTKLGLVSENGATVTDTKTMITIPAWQLFYPARRIITARDFTVALALREWSGTAIKFAFGGGTITGNKYTPPSPDTIDERMLGLDWADGSKHYRLIVNLGMVTDNVATQLHRGAAADLPITFGIIGVAGSDPWSMLTDDPSFAS